MAGTPRLALAATLAAALALSAIAQPVSPVYDAPLPAVLRVCVTAYAPFVMQRAWIGASFGELEVPPGFEEPAGLSGVVFSGANVSLIDGYDIGFVQLVVRDFLGLEVAFYPFPDKSSFYVGIRNGECDFGVGGVEMDPRRAICDHSCPDTTLQPLPELPSADYGQPNYYRLDSQCCFDYGVPYYQSGFALLSLARGGPTTLVDAIVSVDILNAATPVIIAILGFGTVMWLLERKANHAFKSHDAGVYFAFVATSTFGFGDIAPVTVPGRLLLTFWAIFTVLALSAFSGIVSSALTVGQLSTSSIDSLGQVQPSQVCVEGSYDLANRLVAEAFSLQINAEGQAVGVMLGSLEQCTEAVLSGKALVYLSDMPLLNWVAFSFINNGQLYVSPSIRANPLTWVFPSGSLIRQGLDSAVISMIVNGTWVPPRAALEDYWFGASTINTPTSPPQVNVGTLATALVLVFLWLAAVAVRESRDAVLRHRKKTDAGGADDDDKAGSPGGAAAAAAAAAVAMREAARAAERAADAAEAAAAAAEEEAKEKGKALNRRASLTAAAAADVEQCQAA